MTGTDLTTAESWDRLWTKGDNRNRGLRSRLRSQKAWLDMLRQFLAIPDGPADVLEVGCAPGAMIQQLAELRPDHHYRGIDIAEEGLRLAQERLAVAGIKAALSLADMRSADVPPADLVVSFGLVEHFTDPADALRSHAKLAKPGGHVAVNVPNYSHPVVVRAMRWFSPETLATHNLAIMTTDAMRAAMEAAGLTDVQVGEVGGPTLPNSRPRPGVLGKGYKFAARAWNVSSTVLPEGRPWSSGIWGVGTVRS